MRFPKTAESALDINMIRSSRWDHFQHFQIFQIYWDMNLELEHNLNGLRSPRSQSPDRFA